MSLPSTLTDGAQVSPITPRKFAKDLIADFLLGASAAFAVSSVTGVDQAVQQPLVVGFALANAAIAAGYRAVLRWATSD